MDQTLRFPRGQDVALAARLTPPSGMAGWSLAFTVRDGPGGNVVIDKTTAAGMRIADAGRGIVEVTLTPCDTATLTISDALTSGQAYVWELARTDTGQRVALASGQLLLEE